MDEQEQALFGEVVNELRAGDQGAALGHWKLLLTSVAGCNGTYDFDRLSNSILRQADNSGEAKPVLQAA